MKLKKLELFGFKSFYDKTSFEFSDGITAIVGPNGCGKSNIVDAIRWVLGEHAPSYLRSKALEDVIFAGSDAAGPLGMAEVTLTFANENGAGPPGYEAYAEIQVSRRTYRDGESEFFINRLPCRLKDIAELFLDTGAGARGYAIIEQGKISTIVNARPEEKRLIIEEAAGVAKFRVRRREAERKMESTRQNLARVRDVLEEVKRHLGSLERQVRKAERYKALRDELRALDLRVASRRRASLDALEARIGRDLEDAERRIASARSEIARLEAEREGLRADLLAAESASRDLRAALAALKEEVARRQAAWEGRLREQGRLRESIAETEDEAGRIEEGIADLEGRAREGEEAAARRREEIGESRERLSVLSGAAETARAAYLESQSLADRAKSDLMVRVSLHSNARSGAESLQRMMDETARSLARIDERIAEAEAAAGRTSEEHGEALAAESAAREALAAAEAAWEDAGARFAASVARLEETADRRRRVEGRLDAAGSRLSALSMVHEKRDWASAGVKAVLAHYLGGRPPGAEASRGVFGVIGDLIETEATYEKAVEAVLGERIQSVVVRDQSEGLEALHYLKESREGRGAFVPATLRTRGDEPAHVGEEGVIAPLADVVRAPASCGDLVRGLLGGTLLVRDLDCAVRLWNRNGVWNSYVTLDGDVVTADGILVGGAQDTAESGVLGTRREIRELEQEVAVLSVSARQSREDEEAARRDRETLEAARAEAFARREEAQGDLARAEQRRAVVAVALEQAGSSCRSLGDEREYMGAERDRMAADLRATEEAARVSEQARGEEEERVRALAEAVGERRAAMEAAREAFHAAEIAFTGLEERDRSERELLSGLAENLASRRTLLDDRRRQAAAGRERCAALAAEAEEDRGAIDAAAAEAAERQEEIDRRVAGTAALSDRIAGIDAAVRDARGRESEASDAAGALRLDGQRAALERETLDALTYQKYEILAAHLPDLPGEDDPALAAAEEQRAEELRERMAAIGEVNLASLEEHRELAERHAFLQGQKEDLEKSLDDLSRAIQKINRTTKDRFAEAFDRINAQFQEVFPKLFLGGRASLRLLDPENLLESGVEIVASPPGKKLQSLNLLSGGEKALTAVSLIFSIFLVKPSPFCLLDEADAPLDDANVDRFNALVREMASRYQFLLITHNKRTMELADAIYGVTMEKPGISKVVSVKFQA